MKETVARCVFVKNRSYITITTGQRNLLAQFFVIKNFLRLLKHFILLTKAKRSEPNHATFFYHHHLDVVDRHNYTEDGICGPDGTFYLQ